MGDFDGRCLRVCAGLRKVYPVGNERFTTNDEFRIEISEATLSSAPSMQGRGGLRHGSAKASCFQVRCSTACGYAHGPCAHIGVQQRKAGSRKKTKTCSPGREHNIGMLKPHLWVFGRPCRFLPQQQYATRRQAVRCPREPLRKQPHSKLAGAHTRTFFFSFIPFSFQQHQECGASSVPQNQTNNARAHSTSTCTTPPTCLQRGPPTKYNTGRAQSKHGRKWARKKSRTKNLSSHARENDDLGCA